MIMKRYGLAVSLAAWVTLSLFVLMTTLLVGGRLPLEKDEPSWTVDFWPRIEEPEPKRELPKRFDKPQPPPEWEREPTQVPELDGAAVSGIGQHDLVPQEMLVVEGSGNMMPLYKPVPFYPHSARSRGVEGYVIVLLTVTPMGTVKDVQIVYAEPQGYFERSVIAAASKVRYSPSGMPALAKGPQSVRLKYVFNLDA